MEYTKYRIVEKNRQYAIQGLYRGDVIRKEKRWFFKSFWVPVFINGEMVYPEGSWQWLEFTNQGDENYFRIYLNGRQRCVKQYKTLELARTALKDWLWNNLVEPTEQDKQNKEWVAVEKG